MRLAWQWIWNQIAANVAAAGYDDLNLAHLRVFRYRTIDGRRPSELAEEVQITKQSMNELLGHLEQRRYLVRDTDPTDSRARVVRLTPRGRRLEAKVLTSAKAAERQAAALLGKRRFDQLHGALIELVDLVTPSDEPEPMQPSRA